MVAGILAADQATKWVALSALEMDGASYPVVPGLLWFQLIKNTGAAFGLFQSLGPLLALITLVLVYMGYKIARHEDDRLLLWSLSFILGGALGNLVDRILRGGVIDFIRIPNWPLFNVADCFITVGTAGIMLYAIVRRGAAGNETDAPDSV